MNEYSPFFHILFICTHFTTIFGSFCRQKDQLPFYSVGTFFGSFWRRQKDLPSK